VFLLFVVLVGFARRLVPCVFVLQPTPWMLHAPNTDLFRATERPMLPISQMQQQLNSNNRVFDETANETCPSFSFGTPTKNKQKRGERNVNEEGRGPPPTCRLYLYLFFTFLSLSLSLSLSFHSVSCRSSCAWLGWKLWWYNKIRGDDVQRKSSAQRLSTLINCSRTNSQSRVESSFHFNFLLFRLYFNRWWWEKMLSGFFVFVWNSWNHARVFRGEEQLGVNWRNNLRNVADG
jgi:hypothetical protein